MVIKMEMPNPAPNSNSCDVNNCWKIQGGNANIANAQGTTGGGGIRQTVQQAVQRVVNRPAAAAPQQGPATVRQQQMPSAGNVAPSFVPPLSSNVNKMDSH